MSSSNLNTFHGTDPTAYGHRVWTDAIPTDKSKFHIDLRNFLPNNLQPSPPPWLTSLLSTNDPPDSVTQDVLPVALPAHINNAHNLESKVSESHRLLNFLTEQLLAANVHIQDIKTVTHPIRQVQDNAWQEILLFTVAGSRTQSPSIYNTPLAPRSSLSPVAYSSPSYRETVVLHATEFRH
ncbi:hypothetical protein ARMSODRAFT_1027292 [Armillaria solidipes]|uniref:Uncharacterized protein n=1 Tax=Armillaria solidipes TaxID=1076256 RepID=A0A2H3APL6_9AGAR|nr:hypothetical protein ARMSODRAFT_1027292 [Armillaria solidipes]